MVAPKCPRCDKSVFMAEQIAGPGGMWHKSCLTCKNCNKRLDSTSLTERNYEAYCKTCYAKSFGPKGYGYGGGAGILTATTSIPDSVTATSTAVGTTITTARTTKSTASSAPSALDYRIEPKVSLSNMSKSQHGPDSNTTTDSSASSETLVLQPASSTSSISSISTPAAAAGSIGNCCPKCSKQVYFAEQVFGPGGYRYHKMCFKCGECNKTLDSTTMTEKNNMLYCKGCYGKLHGPRGYGFGGGAGVLNMA